MTRLVLAAWLLAAGLLLAAALLARLRWYREPDREPEPLFV